MEMLEYRKYVVSPENKMSYEDFVEWADNRDEFDVKEDLTDVFVKEKSGVRCGTIWYPAPDVGNSALQIINAKMKELDVKRCILVVQTKVTPTATSLIRLLRSEGTIIECFFEHEVQINPTKHVMVPKHIICSADTKKTVLEKYAVKKEQLPQIKSTDAVCRFIGATKGQLIKILRPSGTMTQISSSIKVNDKPQILYDITYRLVV
jgi:DNA-directed RNA polymerase I, II, and III subunit RPABC1